MVEQVSTRELLEELAAAPIGSAELQARPRDENGNVREEVKEAAKRACKIWLPQGRKPNRRPGACNEPEAQQVDLEDAVEAAGGRRGGLRAANV